VDDRTGRLRIHVPGKSRRCTIMVDANLGANEFTFSGDRTQITYLTQTPGPPHSGQLTYQGIEGDHTFTGKEISLERTPLGTL
jgi:hypothetical protein